MASRPDSNLGVTGDKARLSSPLATSDRAFVLQPYLLSIGTYSVPSALPMGQALH